MKHATLSLMTTLLLIFLAGPVQAGDAAAGKSKSATCAGCHGANGVSSMPNTPNLAGQKADYLAKSIKDYRDGKRQNAMMGPVVKGLGDADIDDLAAYYAGLKN